VFLISCTSENEKWIEFRQLILNKDSIRISKNTTKRGMRSLAKLDLLKGKTESNSFLLNAYTTENTKEKMMISVNVHLHHFTSFEFIRESNIWKLDTIYLAK
jgi:hypothetical protein